MPSALLPGRHLVQDTALLERQAVSAPRVSRPWLRWLVPRFSLREMLVAVTMICLAVAGWLHRAKNQQAAAIELSKLGCEWRFGENPWYMMCLPQAICELHDGHIVWTVKEVHVPAQESKDKLGLIFKTIGKLDGVDTLYAGRNPVEREHLLHLSRLWRLKVLDLSGTTVGDEAVETLLRHRSLEELHLNDTQVGSRGVIQLATLPNLETLSLSQTSVGDDGINALAACRSLEELAIDRTVVADEAIARLASLPLKTFSASGTKAGSKMAAAFAKSPTIHSVDVRDSQVTVDDAIAMFRAPDLAFLSFADVTWERREVDALEGKVTQIDTFQTSSDLSPVQWQRIGDQPAITSLHLKGSNCNDEALKHLARLQQLQFCDLTGTKVTAEGLKEFAGHPSLKHLRIAQTAIGDEIASVLPTIPKLRKLDADRRQLSQAAMKKGWDEQAKGWWVGDLLSWEVNRPR
jgi:hypothetical protein